MKTKVASTAELIRERIEASTPGEPFTSSEFLEVGTRASVDQTLSRLAKGQVIVRVTRGVYVRPIINEYVGEVLPEPFKIAQAVARSSGARISMNGAEAARRFELSTQMATQSLYQTTGRSRQIVIGKSKIYLQHTSSRKLALAGRPAGAALSALYYLGKEQVTPLIIEKIRRKLEASEFLTLRNSTESMPSWMSDAFYRYEEIERRELSAA